jgi:formyl-CoA transferase/CoA:oxalate CoA-transferase
VQAESGMISITGEPGGPGVRCGVSIADITAGMYAAFGIVAAVHARQKTGRGQYLDVSMLEGQLGILSVVIGAFVADHMVPQPLGTAYGALLPYQTFRTKTRDIAIGVGSDKLWRTFCPLVSLARLADDPRYGLCGLCVQRGGSPWEC